MRYDGRLFYACSPLRLHQGNYNGLSAKKVVENTRLELREKQLDVKERELELKEAQLKGDADKIAKQERKLAEEKADLKAIAGEPSKSTVVLPIKSHRKI